MVLHPTELAAHFLRASFTAPDLPRRGLPRRHFNFHAAEHGVAGKRIAAIFVHQRVQVGAGICGSHFELCARLIVAPSMRQADNSRHHFVGNLHFRFNGAAIMRDAALPPSSRPSRAASAGLTSAMHRAAPLARTGRLCIQLLLPWSWRLPTITSSGVDRSRSAAGRLRSSMSMAGASSIFPEGVRSTSGTRGSSAPRSIPPSAA